MFPITITIHNHDQLAAVLGAMSAPADVHIAASHAEASANKAQSKPKKPEGVSANEKVALTSDQQAAMDETAGLGKSSAKGADAKPTAEAAKADVPAAKVPYSDLQAAVLRLHKSDPTAAKPIAEAMGFPNFKAMPEERWAEALGKVNAKLEGGV